CMGCVRGGAMQSKLVPVRHTARRSCNDTSPNSPCPPPDRSGKLPPHSTPYPPTNGTEERSPPMAASRPLIRIGIHGPDLFKGPNPASGFGPAGVHNAVIQAEAEPVQLPDSSERSWGEVLEGIHGVVVIGHDKQPARNATDAEALCTWCHDHDIPYLG